MLSSNLKRFREEKGLSQQRLSDISGVARNTISLIEVNKRISPGINIIKSLAKALNITVEELIK